MRKTWRLLLLIAGTFVLAVLALVLASSQDNAVSNSTANTNWTSASR